MEYVVSSFFVFVFTNKGGEGRRGGTQGAYVLLSFRKTYEAENKHHLRRPRLAIDVCHLREVVGTHRARDIRIYLVNNNFSPFSMEPPDPLSLLNPFSSKIA